MTDPKPVTYYYAGELPAHTSFAVDGSVEEFELSRQFKLTNPAHVLHADLLVTQGILSRTAPRKDDTT